MTAHEFELCVVLAVASVSYSLAVRRIERLRRGLTKGQAANVLDVWTMAGALLLPPALVAVLVVIVYAAEWPARKVVNGGRPGRYATSAAILTAAAVSASVVDRQLGGTAIAVLGAIVTGALVNDVLLAAVVATFDDWHIIRRLLSPKNHLIDTVAKLFGVLLSVIIAWHLPLAVLVVPLILGAHRLALSDSIRSTAAFDRRTGLWSRRAWRVRAAELIRDAPACVVLMVIEYGPLGEDAEIAAMLSTLFDGSADPGSAQRTLFSPRARPVPVPPAPARRVGYVIGHCGPQRIALVCDVDLQSAATMLVRHARERLRGGLGSSILGSAVGTAEGLDQLLSRAEDDLTFERITAGVLPD